MSATIESLIHVLNGTSPLDSVTVKATAARAWSGAEEVTTARVTTARDAALKVGYTTEQIDSAARAGTEYADQIATRRTVTS